MAMILSCNICLNIFQCVTHCFNMEPAENIYFENPGAIVTCSFKQNLIKQNNGNLKFIF